MARLDRLPGIREVAQIGSILGREFSYEMLRAIVSIESSDLQMALDKLVDAEVLHQRGGFPRTKYFFNHALVQDAAYQSLLNRTRRYYHAQVAHLLENDYPEVVHAQPELVARHYAQTERNDKTIEYMMRVADKAAGAYAHTEAIAALEEARVHAEDLPTADRDHQVLKLIVRQAESLHFLGRRDDIVHLHGLHQERVERLEEPAIAGPYYFWLGFAHAWLGYRAEAAESLHRSLAEATSAKDDAILGRVHRALATECVYSGKSLKAAIRHGCEASALLQRTEDRFWLSQALFTLSYCYIFAGDFSSSLDVAARLEQFGEATGIRRAKSNSAMLAGLAQAMQGDGEAGIELCERALEISPDPFETAFVLACLGRACFEAGDTARAVVTLEQAVELADQVRSLQFRAWFRTMLGEAYILNGEVYKADYVVQEALKASMNARFLLGVGMSKQVQGRIARSRGQLSQAQSDLEEALQAFSALGALFELARTRLELAETAYGQKDNFSVSSNLRAARAAFEELQIHKYIAYTVQLGDRMGICWEQVNS